MAGPLKILLVEDDPDMLEVFSARFEVGGFDVLQAADGEMALEKAGKGRPDVIVLDLMIPKINGYDVCRTLKSDAALKNIPIIVLSALGQDKDKQKAMECGADAYFVKPLDLRIIIEKINSLLKIKI